MVAFACKFKKITLFPYSALNESGSGNDNKKAKSIECAQNKTIRFGNRFGVDITFNPTNDKFITGNAQWTTELMQDILNKNIKIAVSHGTKLRKQPGGMENLKHQIGDKKFRKLMGNYAVVGYRYQRGEAQFDLLDPGIPKNKYEDGASVKEFPCSKYDPPKDYESRFL